MADFEVRVIDDDQEPFEGARVRLEFTGITGGMTAQEYTDSDGIASFSGHDEGEIQIYIDGTDYGEFNYEDGEQVTIKK